MASNKTYTLYKDANCAELATAQEVYDAYVGGNAKFVLASSNKGISATAEYIAAPSLFMWQDVSASTDDPNAVDGVAMGFFVGGYLEATCGANPPVFAG